MTMFLLELIKWSEKHGIYGICGETRVDIYQASSARWEQRLKHFWFSDLA
jgi:hypothetical protein